MRIGPFRTNDIPRFLALARDEGWVAEEWEFRFLLDAFPAGCLSVLDDRGEGVAFVTALKHGTSGWIGNLLVAGSLRGRGIGRRLFHGALQALKGRGVTTVWLTASPMGIGLYEQYGFNRIDTVVRWKGGARPRRDPLLPSASDDAAIALDALAWGDRRNDLLAAVMGRGRSFFAAGGFVTVQPCGDSFQLGPFVAANERSAADLLCRAFSAVPAGATAFIDAPAGNPAAGALFVEAGLDACGANELMYCGEKPAYRPELVYGLASMGSCG